MLRLVLLTLLLGLTVSVASAQVADGPRVRPPALGQFTPDPDRRPVSASAGEAVDILAARVPVARVRSLVMGSHCIYNPGLGRMVCEAAAEWRCPSVAEILVRVGDGPIETMQCEVDCDGGDRSYPDAGDCDCEFDASTDCS